MGLSTQKAVMVNLDKLAAGHVNRAAGAYRQETIGPLVKTVKAVSSAKEALDRMDAELLQSMKSWALEDAIANDYVQSAMIGRASALPPKHGNAETPKRRNG